MTSFKRIAGILFLQLFLAVSLFAQSRAKAIEDLVSYYHRENLFNGSVLVAEKGQLLYKGGVGMANFEWDIPNTSTTRFRVGSISKQFTSMLILQLVQQGKIGLQQPITAYLPQYRRETGDSVTIHHLLTHSSGIPNYTESDQFFRGDNKQHFTVADFVRKYCSGDLQFQPGSQFYYSNSGYFILGAIIEAVTGKPYDQVLQEYILDPLQLNQTGYDRSAAVIPERAAGYVRKLSGFENADYLDMSLPYSAGSLYSSVEDLYRWHQALSGNKLLPEARQQELYKGFIAVPEAGFFKGDKDSVASGWFVKYIPKQDSSRFTKMIWHSGGINGFLTELARFPEDDVFIAILDNTEGASEALLKDLISLLYDRPTEPKKSNFAHVLRQKIAAGSVAEAYRYYQTLDSAGKQQLDYTRSEQQINRWGYQLLEKNDVAGALMLFEINTQQFPESYNVYDSYAEALARAGQTQKAIENYRKSIELNPSHKRFAQPLIDGLLSKPDTLRVRVDGHDMVLYKTGTQGPVLVLEAGGNSDHRSWSSIVPELAKNAVVITYDRPGYLSSVACNKPRTANRVAEELHEALQKADIKGPYYLGGWSWGGFFARAFAGKYPGETRGLLLIDPAMEEGYQQMARKYPDQYVAMYHERVAVNRAAQDEFDAMLPVFFEASASDQHYNNNIHILIAGSFREFPGKDKPLKQTWIDEIIRWSKKQGAQYEIVDSGHFIQREKPEVVISTIKKMIDKGQAQPKPAIR